MQPITWLAFAYQVPSEPSKARVYAWRKLKEFGAVYFKQSVAILPKSQPNLGKLRVLASKVRDLGGDATIAEMRFIDSSDEDEMVGRFQRQSQLEYREFINDILGLRDGFPRGSHERDESARKMAKRYGQVRSRDYFKSGSLPDIASALDELVGDMSRATDDLAKHLAQMLIEKEN